MNLSTFNDTIDEVAEPRKAPARPWIIAERYAMQRLMAAGGFGQVWEALDQVLGEVVAVKLVPAFGPDAVFRARQELTALRRARLPGVVTLRDDGLEDAYYYLVMERIDGAPFPGLLPVPCPWESLRGRAQRLVQILAAVHFAGLVHLDLKPGNVLVRPDGSPVLLDFGLASGRSLAGDWGKNGGATLAYAPPEQILGHSRGVPSDLYALGAMLYQALSGELPHDDGDDEHRSARRLHRPARPLRERAPRVPAEVAAIIDAMLSLRPEDRPADALTVLAALGGAPPPPFGLAPDPEGPAATEEELRSLFHGPDAFLHLREDAARELWRRTGGWPGWVHAELAGWLSAGLAHWRDDGVALARAELDRLIAGLVVAPAPAEPREDARGETLRWIARLGGQATPTLLRALRPEADAALPQLIAERQAWWLPEGTLAARPLLEDPGARRAAAHRLLELLPPQHPGRLRQLVDAGAASAEILPEILDHLDRLIAEGRAREALALADFGLALLRQSGEDPLELLSRLCAVVLSEEASEFAERALYELGRTPPSPALERLETLLRAARAVRGGAPSQARAALAELPPFTYEPLEIRRVAFGVRAAWAERVDESALEEPARWAGTPERQGWLKTWQGNLAYARLDFALAARLHREAAALRSAGYGRAASQLNAALALLEIAHLEEAEALAAEVSAWSRAQRWPAMEAQAIWLQRHIAYRSGTAGAPRPELAHAAAQLGPFVESLIALNEAAVAWRAGAPALSLAIQAERAARVGRRSLPGLLAAALRIHLGGDREDLEARALEARACPVPGVALQALALLSGQEAPPEILSFAEALSPQDRSRRREILSVDEALTLLRSPGSGKFRPVP